MNSCKFFGVGIAVFFLTMLIPLSASSDFELAKDGQPSAVILVGENPSRNEQLAAYELQYHIRRMTGADLPIINKIAEENRGNVIRIQADRNMIGDSSRIEFDGRNLRLTGSDSSEFGKVDYQDEKTFPKAEYELKGVLFAVYDFLELYCGVRFYGVAERDTFYPEGKSLSVKSKDRIFSPPLEAFRFIHLGGLLKYRAMYSKRECALWQLRWRMNTLYGFANHNQYSIYYSYWAESANPNLAKMFKYRNKDMFAQGYDDKNHPVDPILRESYPNDRDLPPQLCYSSQDAVNYYANEAAIYYRGANVPGGWLNKRGLIPADKTLLPKFKGLPFFYPFQGGDTGGHCLCPRCTERFADTTKDDQSNSKFQFVADIAREAARVQPGAGICTDAYISTLHYPDKVDLPDNLAVTMCLPIYSWWHPTAKLFQMEAYKIWIEKEAKKRPLTIWTYIFSTQWDARFHFSDYKPFPGLYPWKIAGIIRMFARDGIKGIFAETEFRYTPLEAYVVSRLSYDPELDTDKMIDEYFRDRYGAAGDVMKEFYREVESAYWNAENYPAAWRENKKVLLGPYGAKHPYWGTGLQSPDVNWALGTPERMKKLASLIEEAERKVVTPQEKANLSDFIRSIWQPAVEGEKEYRLLKIRRSSPPRKIIPPVMPDYAQGLDSVDWDKAAKTEPWCGNFGESAKRECIASVIADSKNLYIRLHDPQAPQMDKDIWFEDFEVLFHGLNSKFPLYQLAVSPNGKVVQYRYDLINDARNMQTWDLTAEVRSLPKKDSWTVQIAIPRAKLPPAEGGIMINFMRASSEFGSLAWNPIYTKGFVDGADSYGLLALNPIVFQENQLDLWEKGQHTFIEDDPLASNGKTAVAFAGNSWAVKYPVPRHFPAGWYDVVIRMRTDVPADSGNSIQLGVWDFRKKKNRAAVNISVDGFVGQYGDAVIRRVYLEPETAIYVGKSEKECRGCKIFVDYIALTALPESHSPEMTKNDLGDEAAGTAAP